MELKMKVEIMKMVTMATTSTDYISTVEEIRPEQAIKMEKMHCFHRHSYVVARSFVWECL